MMPRAASSLSTICKLSGKRKQGQAAWLMTSAGRRQQAQLGQAGVAALPARHSRIPQAGQQPS